MLILICGMGIRRFEEILSWRKSKELAVLIYKIFNSLDDYGFRNQIQRAAVSIMNNISEGFERQTRKEFRQFLFIAKGSCGEVRSILYLAKDLNLIDETAYKRVMPLTYEISKLLSGLIKSLS